MGLRFPLPPPSCSFLPQASRSLGPICVHSPPEVWKLSICACTCRSIRQKSWTASSAKQAAGSPWSAARLAHAGHVRCGPCTAAQLVSCCENTSPSRRPAQPGQCCALQCRATHVARRGETEHSKATNLTPALALIRCTAPPVAAVASQHRALATMIVLNAAPWS